MDTILLVVSLAAIGFIVYFARRYRDPPRPCPVALWWEAHKHHKFAHRGETSGIAVDPEKRIVHLISTFSFVYHHKSYEFGEIRQWRYNIQTGGTSIYKHDVHDYLHDRKQKQDNESATGLYIAVRDIDLPEWRIDFRPAHDRELQLKRWVEILEQTVRGA